MIQTNSSTINLNGNSSNNDEILASFNANYDVNDIRKYLNIIFEKESYTQDELSVILSDINNFTTKFFNIINNNIFSFEES